eukprot:2950253-Prymnesium_polylepis.1
MARRRRWRRSPAVARRGRRRLPCRSRPLRASREGRGTVGAHECARGDRRRGARHEQRASAYLPVLAEQHDLLQVDVPPRQLAAAGGAPPWKNGHTSRGRRI